jgi:DNA polymerase IV (DinB-like DNA polymerase)
MGAEEREQIVTESSPTDDQIVLHLDMDCFFAACERRRRPELNGEPVVIGGGFDSEPPRGAVATASYEARDYGIESAQPMKVALEKLPRRTDHDGDGPSGIYLKGDHEYYKTVSQEVMDIVREQGETVRRISIDEAYLDVTETLTWGNAEAFATDLKTMISTEVGVTASVGIAPTMSCAKIASDFDKPDGICVVAPDEIEGFLAPLDIETVHGVGPVSADRFRAAGINTAGDLAELSSQAVVEEFGPNAKSLHDRVQGIDPRTVEPVGKPKSISKEKSIEATEGSETKRAVIQALSGQVSERVAAKNVRYRTIGIKVVETPFDVHTRETTLHGPIDEPDLLESTALELLEEFESAEVRKLGVRVSKLDFTPGKQIRLDEWTPPEWAIAKGTKEHQNRIGQTKISDF